MSYFQNPFGQDFRRTWPIDQQVLETIGGNRNNIGQQSISGNTEPYDFSVVNTFTMYFAVDPEFMGYSTISVNVAGATPAATLAGEVVNALNANPLFSDRFTAYATNATRGASAGGAGPYKVVIQTKIPKATIRFYIDNHGAEQKLRFNYQAPVKELPTYFMRDTVDNRWTYPDGQAMLIYLDPADPVDAAVITAAGYDPLVVLADWQLATGRSNTHTFSKITLDGSQRITAIVEYFAGSVAGDLGKKTQYVYTGANTVPDQITTIPYTLTSGDLVTPP